MSVASFERGYNTLKERIDRQTALYFSTCVHCGMCSEACPFFVETQDPKYIPINRLEPLRKVWEREYTIIGKFKALIGFSERLTDAELASYQELVYDSCTLCGKCSLVCPVGNDLTYMLRQLREGMAAAGYAPPELIAATQRAINTGTPSEGGMAALQAKIQEMEKQIGSKIPFDQVGAEYLFTLSATELLNYPQHLSAIVKIMRQAGKTWTLSSNALIISNPAVQIGSSDITKELISRVVTAAKQLQVKTVITPECGHTYVAMRWEGPNLMGAPYPFKVQHILELLDELSSQGKLKLGNGLEEARLTFHDPCQSGRRGGVIDEPKRLLNLVAKNFVEMKEHGQKNACCGGGNGQRSIKNPKANALRLKAFNYKKSQLAQVNVKTVVTACATCRVVLEDGIKANQMNLPVVGLTEMIADHLVK